jgi:hypothetical protein
MYEYIGNIVKNTLLVYLQDQNLLVIFHLSMKEFSMRANVFSDSNTWRCYVSMCGIIPAADITITFTFYNTRKMQTTDSSSFRLQFYTPDVDHLSRNM